MVNVIHLQSTPLLLQCGSASSPIPRGMPRNMMLKCSTENSLSSKAVIKHVLSGVAASLLVLSQTNQVAAVDLFRDSHPNNVCQLASATDTPPTLPLDDESKGKLMMMRGMSAKNFDPVRYSGRWFEVASLKGGFPGIGQEDCHCTQGVYTFDIETLALQVDTFCVHGGPDGYITGIRGKVQCIADEDLAKSVSELEKKEMIKEKCYLRFPTLPFIPKEPYDVIATDYDNFSLVSGAKDNSFIQIYSRKPNPGPGFIEKYKAYLANFGYNPSKIKDTPQDCELMSDSKLAAMMSMSAMQQALTNRFPSLELKSGLELNPFTSALDTFKKLIQLYFK